MSESLVTWLQFLACAGVIAFAGAKLSRYGDVIADKTGMSGSWIGLVLLATVTSLPELVTGISAVTLVDAPNIAAGDVFGSCVFNLLILLVVDLIHRTAPMYRRAAQGHILTAAFGIVMIGFAGLSVMLGSRAATLAIAHIGLYTPVIVLLYFIAMRSIYTYERDQLAVAARTVADRYPKISLSRAMVRYGVAAVAVVGAGTALPFIGVRLAGSMGWHNTFVGTLFIAGATSLPEFAVTIGALRIGALDLAIANLLGSNLFNILILAVDDIMFIKAPLLSAVSAIHAVSAMSAVVMSGIVIIGMLYRTGARIFGTVGWASLALLTIYILNSTVLFLHGE
jgi:cation:H+ antiporter